MLLFLDTEFTDLPQAGKPAPKLISLALVSEDGKDWFYGEIEQGNGWSLPDCSNFVMLEVVPLLKGGEFAMRPKDLKTKLLVWLGAMPRSQTLACDSYIDVEFLKALLGQDWPAKLNPKTYDLRPMIDTSDGDRAVIRCHKERGTNAHNALDDAWANRAGWLAWRSSKRSPAMKRTKKPPLNFLAAHPLLLLNPRLRQIAFDVPEAMLPIIESMADRMEAELRSLVAAGMPFSDLPSVERIEARPDGELIFVADFAEETAGFRAAVIQAQAEIQVIIGKLR